MRAFASFFLAVSIFLLAALGLGTAFARAGPLDDMQNQMFAVTGQINGNCSATLIHSKRDSASGEVVTIFLTAKHCVTGNKSDMFVDLPVYQDNRVVKKDRWIARVRGEFYAGDLALVELRDRQTVFPAVAVLAPAKPTLRMGEDVWTVGYPLGMALTVTQGLFGAIETNDFAGPGGEYFRATPDIAGGNSGGALFRKTASGYELIGVTTARARSDSFVGLYTPIGAIHAYLKVALPDAVGGK